MIVRGLRLCRALVVVFQTISATSVTHSSRLEWPRTHLGSDGEDDNFSSTAHLAPFASQQVHARSWLSSILPATKRQLDHLSILIEYSRSAYNVSHIEALR